MIVPDIADFQRQNAEQMEARAEMLERQSIELCIVASQLRQRAARLRAALAYGTLVKGAAEI